MFLLQVVQGQASHLIKAIQYEAMRLLSPICLHPDNTYVLLLLTAPTGIAAYNLHAATIHNTFHIGTNIKLPYTPLGEDKLNTLRVKYSSLQILIIDEISMLTINYSHIFTVDYDKLNKQVTSPHLVMLVLLLLVIPSSCLL